MSIHKNVAIPSTLNDLLTARDDALRLIEDARKVTEMAKDLLAKHGSHLMPHGSQIPEDAGKIRADLDSRMWRRALDLTGFKQLMDAEAVASFEKSLYQAPPEFTEATICATFIDLRLNAESMFRRGVFNVFRYLSEDYRTNQKEPFRIGRKIIMTYMISPSYRRGLGIRSGSADKLNDMDRVFKTLDNKPFTPRALESEMEVAFNDMLVFENDYYRAKAFQNGNMHMEFKRPDLLDKVNEQIAAHYGDNVLADATAA